MALVWKIVSVLILIGGSAVAEVEIVVTDSQPIAWDEPNTLEDGTPIPAEDVITYELFRALHSEVLSDPQGSVAERSLGPTDRMLGTITFTVGHVEFGDWVLGVRAVRAIGGDSQNLSLLESYDKWIFCE